MEYLEDILVPIFICAILPITIVAIIAWKAVTKEKTRARIITEAISHGKNIDTRQLIDALGKRRLSPAEMAYSRLRQGVIHTLIGISIIACIYFPSGDMDAESRQYLTMAGLIFLAVGAGNFVVYFVSRKRIQQDTDNYLRENCPADDSEADTEKAIEAPTDPEV